MTAVAARLGDRGRRILLVVLAGANAVGLAVTMAGFFLAPVAFDWTAVYADLGRRIGDGRSTSGTRTTRTDTRRSPPMCSLR